MKCTACSRAERSSPADGVSSCKQSPRLSLSSAAPLKNTPLRVCFFNVCKVFCTHLRDFFLNRAWSLSSALGDREYFVLSSPSLAVSSSLNIVCSRRKRRVFLMCAKFFAHICAISFLIARGACRRRYCLFWFFQLEDIVDFPLIHRPYGFIVQFLMINTGNGGSFVQL